MVQLESVCKTFRVGSTTIVALDNVSLTIPRGEIYGVIGLSGAGKSTLVRCINMLESPDSGRIFVDGVELTALRGRALREARKKIGMVFQHFNLLSSRTVFENVSLPLEIARAPRRERAEKVRSLLRLVGLDDKADAYPSELSGGQKQRVGIARALANDPKVLLCDEPTSSLDPETTRTILRLLKRINADLGITVVLITHEMNAVKEICGSVAVIESGRLIEAGPVLDVFTRPKHRTTQALVWGLTRLAAPPDWALEILAAATKSPRKRVVRLSFVGKATGNPVISSVVRDFGVDVNILTAHIDHIGGVPFGTMLVELLGEPARMDAALAFLGDAGARVEVVKDSRELSGETWTSGEPTDACTSGEAEGSRAHGRGWE